MSNLYIHFPFCKQACHYCNFHFSTSKKGRDEFFPLIYRELNLRASEVNTPLESIYFGGGSPSMIAPDTLGDFIAKVKQQFLLHPKVEISLEVNPDDVDERYLNEINLAGINRISLGVQSFLERDLRLMHRAHNVHQVHESLSLVKTYFENYSLDLIYGMPYSTSRDWETNLEQALAYDPPHISTYALTVEKKTALHHMVKTKQVVLIEEDAVKDQYDYLITRMDREGYINYEFSNFGKSGFFSINNQNYWNGKAYLGLGPSSHSYDGKSLRSWNVSNNHQYVSGIVSGKPIREIEELKTKDRYNEYIMTGLRKVEGLSLDYVKRYFGKTYALYLEEQVSRHLDHRNLYWDGDQLKIAKESKFLTDGIAADLFII